MIGASAGAAAMLAPSSASAGASSPAGAAHDPATAAATADPSRSGAARAPAGRAQATAANHEDAGASADNDFASLLQRGITEEPAAAATPAAPPPEPSASGTADAALPDQLLAMLGGAWTQSPTPAAATAAAEPQAAPGAHGPVFPASAAGASPMPTPTLAHVAQAPGRVAGPSDTAMAASAMEIASVAKASGAEDAISATDSGPNAPAFVVPAPAAQAAAAARAMPVTPLAVPADPQAGFDEGFGARLVWMAEQRLGHAEIRLNPEHLGPIEVRVEVDGTEVRAEFQSQHAAVRQAIEASMPRLREMLGQQGLQLGQADVGQRRGGSGQPARDESPLPADGTAAAPAHSIARWVHSRGLVDEYA